MVRSKYTQWSNGWRSVRSFHSSDWLQCRARVAIIYNVYVAERNKQSVMRPALKLCFILHIPHRDCTLLYTQSHLHIFTERHTFLNPKVDEALLVSNSRASPWSSLGVVDDLWNLAVLHWRTVVVPRGAEEQEGRLGSQRRLLRHLLQPFGAVMRVGSLTVRRTEEPEG